jgi:branched-chain amino acid transport system substrate-binding protein
MHRTSFTAARVVCYKGRCAGSWRRTETAMKRFALVAAVAGSLAVGGCSHKVVVGVALPETGSAAVYGSSIKSGIKLALDESVRAQTAPAGLDVQYRDSASDPALAAAAADALYDAGALVVIGGVTSAEATSMIPVADRWERVLLSPSASAPELAKKSVYFFRVFPSDDLEGVKAADLLAITRNARTVLIVQEDNAYTRGLLPVFVGEYQSQGGRVVATVRSGEAGWEKALRDQVAASQPASIYICGYGDATIEVLRVVRSTAYEGTVCVTSAINTATLLQRAGSLAEGVFLPLSGFDTASQQEPVRTFVARYREVYGMTPDLYAAHGYDAALATLAALSGLRTRAGSEVQLKLKGLSEMRGVTGHLAFDDYGNIKHYPRSHWIRGGKVEDYDAYLEREKERIRRQMEELMLKGGGPR